MDQTRHPFYIRHTAHFSTSHAQYGTLRGSHKTDIEHFSREYIERDVESHNKHSYCTSLCIYWDVTFNSFCQCIQERTQKYERGVSKPESECLLINIHDIHRSVHVLHRRLVEY